MRGLPLLALLAAGAAALPHRMGASAVKKVGHVPSRRTAPSLAALDASLGALEADVDKLSSGPGWVGLECRGMARFRTSSRKGVGCLASNANHAR